MTRYAADTSVSADASRSDAGDAAAAHRRERRMTTYLVLLMNRKGHPWSDRAALRLVAADTPESAVSQAHSNPPSLDVASALVIEVKGQLTRVPVVVEQPEWDLPEPAGWTP